MSKFKYSLLAASVTLCFASQAGAASPTYDLGVVTVDGVTTPVEDLSSGFTLDHTGRERQKFCVHGIIGARQTGASNEHEHQTQFS